TINEMTATVALAQLQKIDRLVSTLREKRARLKSLISEVEGIKFRRHNDPEGDRAGHCTIIVDAKERAASVSSTLGSKTIDQSGWHVYANMEHVLDYLKSVGQPHVKGAYPKTDDILSRAMNISIGVVDGGLGAGWGININSTEDEIVAAAEEFTTACVGVSGIRGSRAGAVA